MTSTNSNNNAGNAPGEGTSNGSTHLSNIKAEYQNCVKKGWPTAYLEIREQCDREARDRSYGTSESEKPQNRGLNRYRDVNPYDHSRIIIHRGIVDYINANLVKLERAERKYILTQGPLTATVGHFWLMVWEQNTKAILMLNKLIEKEQVKCHRYWPHHKGTEHALKLEEVKLQVELLKIEEYRNYMRRWFKLTDLDSNQSREIIQFHYTTWPDFGIPSSPVAFLQFLKTVRDSGALDPDVGPAIVHCSAGIGRSGTFCLVDCCLVLVDKEGENNVSVKDVLYEMRRYRMGLIQTSDQLFFSYQAIIEGIKLLKDPDFLEYVEEPSNTDSDTCQQEQCAFEIPPPLPPRTLSLGGGANSGCPGNLTTTLHGKPLPKIPASESFNDDLYSLDNNKINQNDKDALNNFINSEMNSTAPNVSNRPLPPLPIKHHNLLDQVHESDSDDNEIIDNSYDDSDDDDFDDKNKDNDDIINAIDHKLRANNQINQKKRDADDVNANSENNKQSTISSAKSKNDAYETTNKHNGVDNMVHKNTDLSPENELKRRKRVERQNMIEQKVNEIKRKKREAEEKHSSKKRRSLITFLAAGVIVGVICVYAYSKFN